MKIFAAHTAPADLATDKIRAIANDAELAELVASGALDGIERVELISPSSPTAAPTARPCCCAGATTFAATSAPPATC
jgi:hypothetical protein